MDNEKSIAEINEVIAQVEAGLEPGCEIGARDKMTLKGLLRANNIDKNIKFFPCKREISARIVAHFVRVKGIPQSRFSINAQPGIFILCEGIAGGAERKEAEVGKHEKPVQAAPVRKEEKTPKEKRSEKKEKPGKAVKTPKKEKPGKASAPKVKTAKKKKK